MRRRLPALGALAALAALALTAALSPLAAQRTPRCSTEGEVARLPHHLEETSGAAVSIADPRLVWTHNDSGHEAELFALTLDGSVEGRVELDAPALDWEDIAVARCAAGACVYVADTGDNLEARTSVSILRLPEPDPHEHTTAHAQVFPVRLPDGPRDVEALFVLPGERVYLVSKGRNHPATVYRYPGQLRPDTVTLIEVQNLSQGPLAPPRMVTGADASLDGSRVLVRTYQSLHIYRWDAEAGRLAGVPRGEIDLRSLAEPQGEGVAVGRSGRVILTSEGHRGHRPLLTVLRCEGPGF